MTSAYASVNTTFLGMIIRTDTHIAMLYLYIIIPHVKIQCKFPIDRVGVILFDHIVILPAIKGTQLCRKGLQ